MDMKSAYTLLAEIDNSTMGLCRTLHGSQPTGADNRIANAEAILMLQHDRKGLVMEIMTTSYGSKPKLVKPERFSELKSQVEINKESSLLGRLKVYFFSLVR
jgi:hypothetical protein